MKAPQEVYRIALTVPFAEADIYAEALEPYCDAVSWNVWEGKPGARVMAFASGPPDRAGVTAALAVTAAAQGARAPEFAVTRLALKNWVVENLKDFPPLSAGRFFIYGREYSDPVPPGKIGLYVPAGGAFGSGDHGSTRGCLVALDGLQGHPVGAALDMGCGSGILSLAIARRWDAKVTAVDIDPNAVTAAARNARRNGLSGRIETVVANGYRTRALGGRQFDLVVANILARPLTRMARDLGRHLAPGGIAVLSGLLESDGNRVLSAHRHQGLSLTSRITFDGWLTLILKNRLISRR